MKKRVFIILLGILVLIVGCNKTKDNIIDDNFERENIIADEIKDCNVMTKNDDYIIAWSEEFNYQGAPSSSNWSYELGTGNGGWGNNELQTYTNRLDNSIVQDGMLKITAKRESYNGSDFTSARLVSRDKADFKYGYFEVSAKLAGGVGAWPAIWMMPTDSVYGYWPNSGEIDIMEYQGRYPNYVFSTLHTYKNHGSGITSGKKSVADAETTFHKYAMEWDENKITFYYDDVKIHSYTNPKRTSNNNQYWPFDQEFYFVLNVAVGGTLGGTPANDFTESSMYIDYIRVYKKDLSGTDTEKPSDVTIKTSYSSDSTIDISWDAAIDDLGIKQYDIVLNGKQIAATTKTSYSIKNLNPNTEYNIQIIAVDYGNNFKVSNPIKVKTKEILKVPGTIEVEQYYHSLNTYILDNPQGGKSVDISNVNNENGYIVLKVEANKGIYDVEIYAMVPRYNNSLYIYCVDERFNGEKTESTLLTASPGIYNTIKILTTIELEDGTNYIKIEGCSSSIGKIITIDNITLSKK